MAAELRQIAAMEGRDYGFITIKEAKREVIKTVRVADNLWLNRFFVLIRYSIFDIRF